MDPNEALALLIEAVDQHDTDTLVDHAKDLDGWFRSAGFVPRLAYELSQAARLYTNDLFCLELRALIEKHR